MHASNQRKYAYSQLVLLPHSSLPRPYLYWAWQTETLGWPPEILHFRPPNLGFRLN